MENYTHINTCTAPTLATFEIILDELCKLRSALNSCLGISRGEVNQNIYRAAMRLVPLRDCVARMLRHEDTLMADRMWLRLIAELGAQVDYQCFTALGAGKKADALSAVYRAYGAVDHAVDHAGNLCNQARSAA